MRTRQAVGQTVLYCMLCLATETLAAQLYMFALEILQSFGVIASASDAYTMSYTVLSTVLRILPVLFLALFFKMRGQDPIEELRLQPCAAGEAVFATVMGVLSCFAASYLLMLIPFPETWQSEYNEQTAKVLVYSSPVITSISTVVFAPIAEEVVFRGILYGRLRQGIPRVAAALFSATLFGLAHGAAIWFVYTFLLGLLLIYLYEKTGTLLPGILCHMAFNVFGQIGLFPESTPILVVLLVYILSVPLLAVTILLFSMYKRKTA